MMYAEKARQCTIHSSYWQVATGDQFQKGTRHKDSKSLSGGEKSFSQISLLLSLWQGISSPLFCLDEFDVYMDAVNQAEHADDGNYFSFGFIVNYVVHSELLLRDVALFVT